MFVKYKGKTFFAKNLPGGGPCGTLLGLLWFLFLINDIGFSKMKENLRELISSINLQPIAETVNIKI